jgi:hypothetical protein
VNRVREDWISDSWGGQLRQDRAEPLAQPRMQHRIRTVLGRLQAHLAGGGMEQGQDLGRAATDVLVRVPRRMSLRLPGQTRMRHGLEGTRLVLAPDRQPLLGSLRVGLLDQLFLAAAG